MMPTPTALPHGVALILLLSNPLLLWQAEVPSFPDELPESKGQGVLSLATRHNSKTLQVGERAKAEGQTQDTSPSRTNLADPELS